MFVFIMLGDKVQFQTPSQPALPHPPLPPKPPPSSSRIHWLDEPASYWIWMMRLLDQWESEMGTWNGFHLGSQTGPQKLHKANLIMYLREQWVYFFLRLCIVFHLSLKMLDFVFVLFSYSIVITIWKKSDISAKFWYLWICFTNRIINPCMLGPWEIL